MRKLILLLSVLIAINTNAQSNGTQPYSLKNNKISLYVPMLEMANVDHEQLLKEDEENYSKGSKYRIGVVHQVALSSEESGNWETMEDGGKLWRLGIFSPKAEMMNLQFSKFSIPDGGEVFVYSNDYQTILGPFTSESLLENGIFYTEDIVTDQLIVEYYQPSRIQETPHIVIDQVGHIYRNFKGPLGDAQGDCHIPAECIDTVQEQINSVVLLRMQSSSGSWVCSGAMINNTENDNTPYVLTAEHCYEAGTTSWVAYFKHNPSTCGSISIPGNNAISGATVMARANAASSSDFMLLRLTETEANTSKLVQYNPYMAGWDNRGITPALGYAIHHPGGDYKKFSKPSAVSSYSKYWEVSWILAPNNLGVTEGGSSGSPLFNAQGLIVADLCCGTSSCEPVPGDEGQVGTSGTDLYGKLSNSWTNGNTSDNAKKLKPWLDPNNSGATILQGRYYNDPVSVINYSAPQTAPLNMYPNPSTGMVTFELPFNISSANIKIYNVLGVEVANLSAKTTTINLSHLPVGVYQVQLLEGDVLYHNKLIITK